MGRRTRKPKNPNRVAGGKKGASKNRWLSHLSICRAKHGTSLKGGMMSCRGSYSGVRPRGFAMGIALKSAKMGLRKVAI